MSALSNVPTLPILFAYPNLGSRAKIGQNHNRMLTLNISDPTVVWQKGLLTACDSQARTIDRVQLLSKFNSGFFAGGCSVDSFGKRESRVIFDTDRQIAITKPDIAKNWNLYPLERKMEATL